MHQKDVAIITFYWITFILSCIIIFLHVGLVLLVFGVFILALLALHFYIGIKIHALKQVNKWIFLSSLNLLLFSLVRIDGVHVISDNGLSTFLRIFEIYAGYTPELESFCFFATFILFFVQLYIDAHLLNKWRSLKNNQPIQK